LGVIPVREGRILILQAGKFAISGGRRFPNEICFPENSLFWEGEEKGKVSILGVGVLGGFMIQAKKKKKG